MTIAVVLAGAGACGGSTNTGLGGSGGTAGAGGNDASTVCVPGQSISCAGPKGCNGSRVCRSDGSGYVPCDCGTGGSGGTGGAGGAAGSGGTGGTAGASGAGGAGGGSSTFPTSCAEAAKQQSAYGCEFWPTVTENPVWPIFDFAVLVQNPGTSSASVTATRGGTAVTSATIPGGQTGTLYLPWVKQLKGADSDSCGNTDASQPTVRVDQGAYRLSSDVPVGVYQFNAYEYAGAGGPPGKDWSTCPGTQICSSTGQAYGCYSFSNDASLLMPSTSLGTSYRVTGEQGWPAADIGPYVVITGTRDGTSVTVQLSSTADALAGGGVSATSAGGTVQLALNAGDVVSLASSPTADSSGTLVSSDKPVQVIAGMSCLQSPIGTQACDHVEETVLPSTALGRDYFVAVPTGPKGKPVGHVVRLYGHVDNTTLTFPSGTPPAGAPTSLSAGQVVNLGNVGQAFEVKGDHPFGVTSVLLGGYLLDPNAATSPTAEGDPSQTDVAPVGQYRRAYAFAVAQGYDATYLDIVAPLGTKLTLDGVQPSASVTAIGNSSYATTRIPVPASPGMVHVLRGDVAFGAQITGYGSYTSYQYPAGLDARTLP